MEKEIEYYDNEQIKEEYNYIDDEKHGRYISYHENGDIKED